MHNACKPDLAAHTTHRTKPAPASSPTALHRASHVPKFCGTTAAPHSALAAGVDTPQPAALGNCQLCVSPACQWPRSRSRPKLKFQQSRAVFNHNASSFYGSALLRHRRVHSHPHCVAARLQSCSANLHLFLHHPAISPHRRRILWIVFEIRSTSMNYGAQEKRHGRPGINPSR